MEHERTNLKCTSAVFLEYYKYELQKSFPLISEAASKKMRR